MKVFVNFQGKHPRGKTFLTKLQVTWHFLGMLSWKIYEIFTTAFIKATTNGVFCNMLLLKLSYFV